MTRLGENAVRVGAVSLALVALLAACKDAERQPAADPKRLLLPTATVQETEFPRIYSVPGSVVSDDRIELSSRVVGFIQSLDLREGQRVSTGDLLVQIDSADIDEAIRQAEAGVATARNDLADAEHDVVKYAKLAEQGWIASEVLRKARVRRDIAQSSLARAEAARAAAQVQKTYAVIVSPVDGVVVARHKHKGDMATAGTPILTIESRRILLFKIFVAEGRLPLIDRAMPVTVRIDALAARAIEGTVQRIVPSGDPVTRRYEVTVALPSDPALMPGMFGRAEIVLGTAAASVVPVEAKVQRGGLDGVFVVGGDNVARFRWLRFGREWNGMIEVAAGLSPGETIVTRVDEAVRDGTVITAALSPERLPRSP